MVKTTLKTKTPPGFNFRRTIYSHGWSELPPCEIDDENWIFTRVFALEHAAPVTATIREGEKDFLRIEVAGKINAKNAERIVRDARHILRLDEDFAEFYNLANAHPELAWVGAGGAGRLLRSPTVWEDLVKTICTTNCSWALTKKMVTNLVEKLGEPTADGRKTFPTPAKMAEQTVDFYKNEIRAGYRSAYFLELAEKVAVGEVDVESWATTDVPTAQLKKQMKQIKGVGDYAAENLLKLVGRYDGLALDSWLRMRFAKIRNEGENCSDEQIRRHYERFGEWRGLAIWCDMTSDWL